MKRKIYFEKQSKDRLCGLHCLNSLMQGPFFDLIQLSEIALDIDKQENLLLGGKQSAHENVDDDGNYNIQVLTMALNLYNASISPLKAKQVISLIEQGENIESLIFNSSTHWFAIRKINNVWYDLNSTNKAPKVISEFFLSAFIQGSEDIGYSNFLVRNLPPLPDEEYYLELQNHQLLFSIEEIAKIRDDETKDKREKQQTKEEKEKQNKEEEKFKGKGTILLDNNNHEDEYDDPDMKLAMEMSMNLLVEDLSSKLPKEPLESDTNAYSIVFRYLNNQFTRRFNENDTIHIVKQFAQVNIRTFKEIELSESFPFKVLNDDILTIKEAKLSKRQMLNVKLL